MYSKLIKIVLSISCAIFLFLPLTMSAIVYAAGPSDPGTGGGGGFDPDACKSFSTFSSWVTSGPISPGHPTMLAQFKVDGCTLEEVKNNFGYDHFNWLQLVTAHPDGFALNVPEDSIIPTILIPPFLDPPLGGGSVVGGPADLWPFYWDEATNLNDLNPNTTATTLFFKDTPSWETNSFEDPLKFSTSLVGVFPNKTYHVLNTFNWKSSYNGTVGGVYKLKNTGDPDFGTGTGGIFDIENNVPIESFSAEALELLASTGARDLPIGPVPEPATFILFGIGTLGAMLKCKRRQNI